ncbi:MAG: hypothetical protein II780_05030 [Clostridia bacterium]|nr:hypothetical protein [Clostridia bacterium]MBR6136211.1 hypothetical protein [Clostridia bacterium]
MKKFLLVLMAVMIVFSLCSCGLFRKLFGKDEPYLETLEYYSDSKDPKYRRVVISRPSYDSKATITVYYADGDVKKKEISSVALNTIEAFIGKIEDAEDKEGNDKEHLLLKWSDGRVMYVNLLNKREDEMSFFDSVRDALDKLVDSLNLK